MKNIFTFFFAAVCLTLPFTVFTQDIPNNSFENWVDSGTYLNPEHWDTGNMTVMTSTTVTTYRTEDSYTGQYAARMQTKSVLTFQVPGLITLGDFNLNIWTQESSITGGVEFSFRPQALNLFYKYSPAQGDFFRIGVWLLRDDGTAIPDTVATGLYEGYLNIDEYTLLTVPLEYRSEEIPEILNIIAVSSDPDNPKVGSVLFVDDFSFEYPVGKLELNEHLQTVVYPNPAYDYIKISKKYSDLNIEIYNITGSLVKTILKHNSDEKISIRELESGAYIIRIVKNNSDVISTHKLLKL